MIQLQLRLDRIYELALAIRDLTELHETRGAAGVENMVGFSCSELILRYTMLGGSHVRFPKDGRVQTRATRAVAGPMHGTRNFMRSK